MREITSYWIDVLREITSYCFDVQKRANFKQLCCAMCRFPHSYLTYVQFAAGIKFYSMGQEITHYSRGKLHVGQITVKESTRSTK